MTNWKYIALATVGGLTLMTTTAGAAGSQVSNLNTAVPTNMSQSVSPTALKVQKLDQFDNSIGAGWIGENKVIVLKENEKLPLIGSGLTEHHLKNLYIHDLATGKDTLMKEIKADIASPVISPDKDYVLYQSYVDGLVEGFYILNVKTGKTVKAAGLAEAFVFSGSWLDSKHYIYPNMEGNLVSVDVNGKSEILLKTGKKVINYVVRSGSMIYYSYYVGGTETQLMSYNPKSKKTTTLLKNVSSVIPSRDGSQVVMVKRELDNNLLVLTDSNGKTKSTIASGNQIYGMSWSPDASKLAYVIETKNEKNQGSFIFDVKTGNQLKLVDDTHFVPSLPWSPSGKQVMIPSPVNNLEKSEGKITKTYIATLS